jgi:REP element-mobilizing transposase RayT
MVDTINTGTGNNKGESGTIYRHMTNRQMEDHDLAHQKENKVIEEHLQPDHIHMLIAIPPMDNYSMRRRL